MKLESSMLKAKKKYWLSPRDLTSGSYGENFWGESLVLNSYGGGDWVVVLAFFVCVT